MSDSLVESIAIVGLHGRFPGARTVDELWANLIAGRESISFFSDAELAEAGLNPAALARTGHYVPARGILEDAEYFDAAFFGIHPKEAEVMDPQQRVFLEGCWEALERAGYAPTRIRGAVGVYAGATHNTYYLHHLHGLPELRELVGSEQVMLGNEKDYLATRVAYKLNLMGPAISLNTACSSSLVAICQACQALLTYQCDLALAGGVSVTVPQRRGYFFQEGNIGSPDGHTRTFDEKAGGTVFSNGLSLVVLKRLSEAVADGDHIYAVIKGMAVNNDGSQRVSFGAPGVEGQSQVISLAQAVAGVEPESITYVEAHGTATPIGDPIEVAALTKAFRQGTQRKQFCGIGSIKSNIGHLDAAAGGAGLIKTALALKHHVLPPSLHFVRSNPKIDLENSPFFVNASLREWKSEIGPLRAGVSSFGTGGTNAHVIVEEAPAPEPSGPSRPLQLLVLSAKTASALELASRNFLDYLRANQQANLADVAFTLQTGRSEFIHRRAWVARNASEAPEVLEKKDPKVVFTAKQELKEPPVVFMFPGQGAQYVHMGAQVYRNEAVFRTEVDRCAELLNPILGTDLRTILYPKSEVETVTATQQLVQTRFTQPALFTVEYALAKLWISWGIVPAAFIGHSIGEYVAACLAGVFSLEDSLALVARRAELVQAQAPGCMLAVRLPEQEILPFLTEPLSVAAVNSPKLCVVSGPAELMADLEARLAEKGVAGLRLCTSHAFHSAMMEPVVAPFAKFLRATKLCAPKIPFVSNLTARWITSEEATNPDYWAAQVRKTVRFADGIAEMAKDARRVLLEVGPGQTLTQLARQHPARSEEQPVIASLSAIPDQEYSSLLTALGRMWVAGATVDWQGFYRNERRRRVVLPTYPFERKRYLPEGPALKDPVNAAGGETASKPTRETPMSPTGLIEDPTANSPELVPAPSAEVVPIIPRYASLIAGARTLFQELSGTNLEGVDPAANFLELGFDSLLLTQAAQLLQRKFGVSISFRQVMEELCSLEALAAYLDRSLPPEPPPQDRPALRPPASPPTGSGAESSEKPAEAACVSMEELIKQQLKIANQMLDVVQQTRGNAVFLPNKPVAVQPQSPTISTPDPGQKAFGPYKAIEKTAGSGTLSESQMGFVKTLIARYTHRTQKSKQHTQRHRRQLADPRTIAGFRPYWKEMVYPLVVERSLGSRMWDIDGVEYIDFSMGFGADLIGHSPPFITAAIEEQLRKGIEVGPQTPLAGKVAQLMCELTGMDRCAFCNTGSEAVLAAIRVARTVTGRSRLVYFTGDYHGIFDEVLQRAVGNLGEQRSFPIAPGIPEQQKQNLLILDYERPESLEMIRSLGPEIAAVIVEPVQSRHPDLQPREFLQDLRRITNDMGSALIFDEVITGFRCHPGGAQALFGIRADLATYGKLVGGGMPIGAVCGSAKFMDALDGGFWSYGDISIPEVGMTFFAGTFVRHPLTVAASWAMLNHLKQQGPDLQRGLNQRMAELVKVLNSFVREHDLPVHLEHFSSFFWVRFESSVKHGSLLFFLLRDKGIHIFEGRLFFLSTAHTEADLEQFVRAFQESLLEMHTHGFLPRGENHSEPRAVPADRAFSPSIQDPNGVSGDIKSASAVAAGNGRAGAEIKDSASLTLPLTESQRGLWFVSKLALEGDRAYTESTTLRLRGPLDLRLLHSALRSTVNTHEALRTEIDPSGEKQTIHPHLDFEVPPVDLTGVTQPDQESELQRQFAEIESSALKFAPAPVFDARVLRLAEDHHLLVLRFHHLFGNGPSYEVFFGDLCTAYSALQAGRLPHFEPAMQLSDYVRWREQQLRAPVFEQDRDFWLRQFAGSVAVLDLPTDHPRPSVMTCRGGRASLRIESSLTSALRKTSGKLHSSMFMMLFTAFRILLQRLSGQDDLVIGIPSEGLARNLPRGERLFANTTNLLPLRSRILSAMPFAEALAATKSLILKAKEHQSYFFGRLIQDLKLRPDPSRSPINSVSFNFERGVFCRQLGALNVELILEGVPFSNPKDTSKFELTINIADRGDHLLVECDYSRDLFAANTIQRWLDHYQTLLKSIIADPMRSAGHLALLGDAEQYQMLVEWNRNAVEYPREKTVHRLFDEQVARHPDKVAVEFQGDCLTYGELASRADTLAAALREQGVGVETAVGVHCERSLGMVVAVLGILKAGGAYVPLDPSLPQERMALMIEDAAIPVIVSQSGIRSSLPPSRAKEICVDSDDLRLQPRLLDANKHAESAAENLAYIMFTSGSTGRPKGVQISHRAVVNFLESMRREPGLVPEDTLVAVTTLSFDISGLELLLPLLTGARIILASRESAADPTQLIQLLKRPGVSVMQATPVSWRMLIDAGWEGDPKLKILCGGEAMSRDLAEQLLKRCGELWHMYGPTETTIWSATVRLRSSEHITIGRPISNTQIYILDDLQQPVPVGVIGTLHIGGDGLARGYLNLPDLTRERFLKNPFIPDPGARMYCTGDLARFLPDGQIDFIGRADHQAKVRGFRIELGEIEAALVRHGRISEAVVGTCDGAGGPRLLAYLVADSASGAPPSASELRTHLKRILPEYMVPSAFLFLEKLPVTPNGKINRKALPAPGSSDLRDEALMEAPQGPVEAALAALWSELLDISRVGRNEGFFNLGGHSLIAARLMVLIEKRFDVKLPLALLLEADTIAKLADKISSHGDLPKTYSSLVVVQGKGERPPFFCIHGAGGNVLLYRALARRLGETIPFFGLQSVGLDGVTPYLTSIEDMAQAYLKEVTLEQPVGPYFLGGYCMGGLVAYEMACRLRLRGLQVAFVALLDTYNPQVVTDSMLQGHRSSYLKELVGFHWKNLVSLSTRNRVLYLKEKSRMAAEAAYMRVSHKLRRGLAGSSSLRRTLQQINDDAGNRYRPQNYPGDVVVFRPSKNYSLFSDPTLGWGACVTGKIDAVELPMNPHAMLTEPYVETLASELGPRLVAARSVSPGVRLGG